MSDSVLNSILHHKVEEVARQRRKVSDAVIQRRAAAGPPIRSFSNALTRHPRPGLIAEVKHASPSRGILIDPFEPLTIAATYTQGGAAALSVLTDQRFFKGSLKYLEGIRQQDSVAPDGHHPPLLRKDFIIDPYQVYEARAYGADALLLIVAALTDAEIRTLYDLTYQLGMEVLVEVHDDHELKRALDLDVAIIGVNNRNLHTFDVSLDVTAQVFAKIPRERNIILVSESGIFNAIDVTTVGRNGANAILVGEALIKAPDMLAKTRELAGT